MLNGEHTLASIASRALGQAPDDDQIARFAWTATNHGALWTGTGRLYPWAATNPSAARTLISDPATGALHAADLLVCGIDDPDVRAEALKVAQPWRLAKALTAATDVATSTIDTIVGTDRLDDDHRRWLHTIADNATARIASTHPHITDAVRSARRRLLSPTGIAVHGVARAGLGTVARRWLAYHSSTVDDALRWWHPDVLDDPFDVYRAVWSCRFGQLDGDVAPVLDRLRNWPHYDSLAAPLLDDTTPVATAADPATPVDVAAELLEHPGPWAEQIASVRPGDPDWLGLTVNTGITMYGWLPWPREAASVTTHVTTTDQNPDTAGHVLMTLGRRWDDIDLVVDATPVRLLAGIVATSPLLPVAARHISQACDADPELIGVAAAAVEADPHITVGTVCGLLRRLAR